MSSSLERIRKIHKKHVDFLNNELDYAEFARSIALECAKLAAKTGRELDVSGDIPPLAHSISIAIQQHFGCSGNPLEG